MSIKWILTSDEVYSAICRTHFKELQVHGTITDLGGYTGEGHIMTEWGLPGSDYPLIKRDDRAGVSSYWIAVAIKDDEE